MQVHLFDDEVADRSSVRNPESTKSKKGLQTVQSKKRMNNRKLMQSFCHSLYISLEYYSLSGKKKKRKKSVCHKAVCCAVALKWQRYPNRKHNETYWQYLNQNTHQQKHLSNSTGSCLLRENSASRTVGLRRETKENNFRDWKPTISLRINLSESHSKSLYWETPQKIK